MPEFAKKKLRKVSEKCFYSAPSHVHNDKKSVLSIKESYLTKKGLKFLQMPSPPPPVWVSLTEKAFFVFDKFPIGKGAKKTRIANALDCHA